MRLAAPWKARTARLLAFETFPSMLHAAESIFDAQYVQCDARSSDSRTRGGRSLKREKEWEVSRSEVLCDLHKRVEDLRDGIGTRGLIWDGWRFDTIIIHIIQIKGQGKGEGNDGVARLATPSKWGVYCRFILSVIVNICIVHQRCISRKVT